MKRNGKRPRAHRQKSAGKSASGRPFARGQDARRGHGPAKGAPNAGRPTEAFRQAMRAIASSDEAVAVVWRAVLAGDLKALEFATRHGYGNPVQALEHSGFEGGPIEHELNLANVPGALLEEYEGWRRKLEAASQ